MTRQELIEMIAWTIAEMEGFHLTAAQANARRIPHPTLAQINANPGNIRQWRDKRDPYPWRNLLDSANQRLHLLTNRYRVGDFAGLPIGEVILHRDGSITVPRFQPVTGLSKPGRD